MNKLVLLLIASIAILAFSQASPVCSSNADCNDFSTLDDKICDTNADPLLRTCVARTSFDFKTSNSDPKGKCKDSFNFGGSSNTVCGHYAMLDCDIPDADTAFFRCIDSDRDATTKKCKGPTVAATYVGEGARCDGRTDKRIFCGDNLVCVDNVCRAKVDAYGNCDPASTHTCKNGYTCNGDFCEPSRIWFDGQRCKGAGVCRDAVCNFGVCYSRRTIPCHSDSHCASIGEVCYKQSGSVRGFCTTGSNGGAIKFAECQRNSLQALTATKPTNVGCDKTITEHVCAVACKKRVDQRIPFTDLAYTYNCATMTRTPIAAGTCAVKEFISGCPSVPLA